jgi:putative DNA-invertase from lambdoid prophage Rac
MASPKKISERTRDAKRYLSSQGVFIGGSRPFGYDIVEDGDVKRLVPNEAEHAVVDRMKAMRQAGSSYRAIGAETGHQPMTIKRILDRVAG